MFVGQWLSKKMSGEKSKQRQHKRVGGIKEDAM